MHACAPAGALAVSADDGGGAPWVLRLRGGSQIRPHVPVRLWISSAWTLVYSTMVRGISLHTLLDRSYACNGPTLLVVSDSQGAVRFLAPVRWTSPIPGLTTMRTLCVSSARGNDADLWRVLLGALDGRYAVPRHRRKVPPVPTRQARPHLLT